MERFWTVGSSLRFAAPILFYVVVTLIGGGTRPVLDLVAELLAVALLLIVLWHRPADSATLRIPAYALILFACAVPLVQLVPLPIELWRQLPGRELPLLIHQVAGPLPSSLPISLIPEATKLSALAMLPAIAMFMATIDASSHGRAVLFKLVAVVALLNVVFAVLQLTTSGFYPFPTPHQGSAVGLFANRNHHADMLIVGMFAVAAVDLPGGPVGRGIKAMIIALLALTVVTTTSRTGMLLMLAALPVSLAMTLGLPSRRALLRMLATITAIVVVFALLSLSPVVSGVIARFASSSEDLRLVIWQDTLFAAGQFWPIGSGIGTFVPVYATVENLDAVQAQWVNHAHNEYLELLLETGVAGPVGVVAYLALLAVAIWRLRGRWNRQALAALSIIVVLMLHSIVDYPLRRASLMATLGLANGILLAIAGRRVRVDPPASSERT